MYSGIENKHKDKLHGVSTKRDDTMKCSVFWRYNLHELARPDKNSFNGRHARMISATKRRQEAKTKFHQGRLIA